MGWLLRYTGLYAAVLVPPGETEPRKVRKGELIDVAPSPGVQQAVGERFQPWERVLPGHKKYVPPEDR